VTPWRCDATPTGFVLEFEERWSQGSQRWYSRELARADVTGGAVSELSVYGTGDWDEALQERHAREVALLRPWRRRLENRSLDDPGKRYGAGGGRLAGCERRRRKSRFFNL
jgi:hypothetical protein